MRRLTLCVLAALAVAGAAPAARADEDDAARAARWTDIRHAVFGERAMQEDPAVIQLDAPPRALDAALVPVAVTLSGPRRVRAVWLVIDDNPSPLAGTFRFGAAASPTLLKTRVRVDQYTLMHAVAETDDGRLHLAARFVKAAGGCSAPAGQNDAEAMLRIGRMRLRLPRPPAAGQPVTAELLISHPNHNGMQMDQVTRNYTPARFVRDIAVRWNDTPVLDVESDISLSENPAITFAFTPEGEGRLNVTVTDSTDAVFRRSFDLATSFERPSDGS